jgi:hypothetical protein
VPVPGTTLSARRTPLSHYLRVQRVTDRELAQLLLQAAESTERAILRAGGTNIGAQVRRAQLIQVQRQLRIRAATLWRGAEASIRQGAKASALSAVDALEDMDRVLFTALGDSADQLVRGLRAQARAGVDNILSRTQFHPSLAESVYKQQRVTDGTIGRLVNNALGRGASWQELARDVRRHINPRVPGGISYAAKRLARTELNNAFHTTTTRLALDEPWTTGMRWHLSGSHPRPDECNTYAERDHDRLGAGVFKVGNVPAKPHPQCLCYVTTVTIGEEEFQQAFLDGKYDRYLERVIREYDPDFRL